MQAANAAGPASALSARELDVLRLLVDGMDNTQIGRSLYISPRTVKIHVSRILAKLGVANRVQAAVHATRTGMLDASGGGSSRRVMVCFGTRPELIKVAPVIRAVDRHDALSAITVSTGQHRQMLDQMLAFFGITPDIELAVMRPGQALSALTSRMVDGLARVMAAEQPDAVLVQGDTTTTLCASLAAFYAGVPVGHVEAGLRTYDMSRPFPEEMNRRLVAPLARWHFCPTKRSALNLKTEGIPEERLVVTGNTVVDSLLETARRPEEAGSADGVPPKARRRRILVTLHRRETQGREQRALCHMLAELADRPDVEIVFPVHLSPSVRESVQAELAGRDNVHLLDPLDYPRFVRVLRESDLVLTDSGGIQEEAPSLAVPVLVMRDTTERPEGVDAGCVRLCGTRPERVRRQAEFLLDSDTTHRRMARAVNPYGDGHAGERIVATVARDLAPEAEAEPLMAPANG